MIHLLFTVLAAEAGLATTLLFKTPARKLAMFALDRLKRGRGPVMVRTVAVTVLVVLASSLHSMTKIHGHAGAGELDAPGALSPTDQVLLARHLLEASLMGYALFLAFVIDRLHNYIREMRALKKNLEAVTKQNKTLQEGKFGSSDDDDDESKAHKKDIASLNEEIKKLKHELKEKKKDVKDAEAKALAAKTQSEGLMLKYDRLLEDNKHLLDQVQSGDIAVSRSEGKKNT